MFFNAGIIAVMIMHIQIVQSQNEVTLTKESTILHCLDHLILKCTYTGNTSACCSLTREWRVNNLPVMTDGNVASTVQAGKYAEGEVNHSGKYFTIIINYLKNADLEKSYSCTYDFDDLKTEVTVGSSCWCYYCGLIVYGYSSIISPVIDIGTAIVGVYQEHEDLEDLKRIAVAFFFSLFVTGLCNFILAGTTGIYSCLCLDNKEPWFTLCGMGTGLVGTISAVIIHKKFNLARYVWLLGLLAVVTIVTEIAVLTAIGGYLKDLALCEICGGRSFLWVFIGTVVALLFMFGILLGILKQSAKRSAIFSILIWAMSLVVDAVLSVPIGTYLCPCFDWNHPYFIILGLGLSLVIFGVFWLNSVFDVDECTLNLSLCFAGRVVLSFLIFPIPFLFIYCCLKDDADSSLKKCLRVIGILVLAILIFPIPFLIIYFCLEEFFQYTRTNIGSNVQFKCPHKDTIGQINWIRINGTSRTTYSEGTSNNLPDLPKELVKRLTVKDRDLFISNVQKSDSGIYTCELSPEDGSTEPQVVKLQLTVRGGGKNQSVESGSSCWPICRVGQDPNTSSSDPEKVRRSPEKERADKKKERKPTEVVRPQPSRPLPSRAQHLKTDNTGREEYSAENELFKPRPLPSISGHSDSPRPLPKRTPDDQLEKGGIQLEPLVDSTSEKKKKKKRKKKETKQSDEDD